LLFGLAILAIQRNRPRFWALALVAAGICLGGIASAFRYNVARLTGLIPANAMALLCVIPLFNFVRDKKTNIDLVAAEIQTSDDAPY
jgi:hypothetical protein